MQKNKLPTRLLTFAELRKTRGIGYSRQHLKVLEGQKKFPRRVAAGDNRVGWVESEIDDYLERRLAARPA